MWKNLEDDWDYLVRRSSLCFLFCFWILKGRERERESSSVVRKEGDRQKVKELYLVLDKYFHWLLSVFSTVFYFYTSLRRFNSYSNTPSSQLSQSTIHHFICIYIHTSYILYKVIFPIWKKKLYKCNRYCLLHNILIGKK